MTATWTKSTLLHYFHKHLGESVLLEEQGTRIKVQGIITEVDEMDLCSTTLFETTLQMEREGIEVALTFHEEFIGVHLLAYAADHTTPQISFPYQIRYDQLILNATQAPATQVAEGANPL